MANDSDPSSKSLEQQLRLQQSIVNSVAEMNKARERDLRLLQDVSKSLGTNKQLTQDTAARLAEMNEGIALGSKRVKESKDAWGVLGNMYDKVRDAATKWRDEMSETTKRLAKQGVVVSAAEQGLAGLASAIGSLGAGARVGISVLGGMARSLWEIGKSILAIPIGIFTGLVDKASQMGGDNALAQAFEDLRKEMGAFNQHEAQDVIRTFRSMRGELSNTGLSVYRVFGNLADRLKEVTKLATEMGPVWHVQSDNIARNAEAVMAYQKGLGLSGEMMKAIGARASALGRNISEPLREMAGMSLQMGRQFHMSAKLISRDVGEMTKDFKNFGGLGVRVMTSVSVFARRLGVDFKGLLGVVDKFDNFEDAATNAAKLSQSFGLNIDAMKMMKEQDPAARFEMLRKSFAATGRSVEQMTRQERALLASTTGLSEEVVVQGLALKNQGVSYAEITRQAQTAEHRQLSQAEAMKQLASAIERITQSGQLQKGGFWDQFVRGLNSGIERSMSFRRLMMTLNRDLRETFYSGRRVGRAFVEMFPGIREVLSGITQMFDRNRFRTMIHGVVDQFREFFRMVQTDPKAGLLTLFKNLKQNFLSWFDRGSPRGQQILNGFKSFFTAMSGITAGLAEQVMKGITQAISGITEFIRNPSAYLNTAASNGTGLVSFVSRLLIPVWQSIRDAWPALKQALVGPNGLFMTIWEKLGNAWESHKGKIVEFLKRYSGYIGTYLIAAFTTRAFFGGVAAAIGKGLVTAAAGGVTAAARSAPAMARAAQRLSSAATQAAGAAENVGNAVSGAHIPSAQEGGAIAGFVKALNGLNWGSIGKLTLTLIGIAAALSTGGIAMAMAIVKMDDVLKSGNVDGVGVAKALAVIATTAVAMVPVSLAAKLIKDVKLSELAKGLGIVAAGIGIVALTFAAIMAGMQLGDIGSSDVQNVARATGSMISVFTSAAGLVVAASAIGVVIGTGVGGIAAALGMSTLAMVVSRVSGTVKDVITSLAEVRVDSGMTEKVTAFTAITSSINSIAQTFVSFIRATTPSFTELITGQGTFSGNFKSVNRFLKDMIGDERGGLIGMIHSIKTVVAAIGSDASTTRGAAILGPMLAGVGEVLKATTPSDAFWKATEAFNENWSTTNSSGITELSSHMSSTMNQIGILLTQIGAAATNFSGININETQIKSLEAIGPLLTSIGSVINAMMPGPEFWKAATNTSTTSLFGGTLSGVTAGVGTMNASSVNSGAIGALQNFLVQGIGALGGLFNALGGFISAIGPSLGNVTADQIRALTAIGPILTTTGTMVGSLATLGSETQKQARSGAAGGASRFKAQLDSMSEFITGLGDQIPRILEKIGTVVRQLVIADNAARITPEQFKSKIDGMKSMFDLVATIPGIVNGISGGQQTSGGNIQGLLGNLDSIFTTLFGGSTGTTSTVGFMSKINGYLSTIPNIDASKVTKLKTVGSVLSSVSTAVTSLTAVKTGIDGLGVINTESITKLNNGMAGIESIVLAVNNPSSTQDGGSLTNLRTFSGNLNKFQEVSRIIERVRFTHVHEVISGMVEKMNALSASLQQSLNPQVDLRADLQVLANNVGLGNTQDYTINHRNFEINMRVDVRIDTADLKKILLGSPNLEFQASNHTTG